MTDLIGGKFRNAKMLRWANVVLGATLAAFAGSYTFGGPQLRFVAAQLPPSGNGSLSAFEVVSIRPSRSRGLGTMTSIRPSGFVAHGMTAKMLIMFAYDLKEFQIFGAPKWADSESYDIEAKVADSAAEELQKSPLVQRRQRLLYPLQLMLADRFSLKVSHATRELPIYALVVAKNGPRIHPTQADEAHQNSTETSPGRISGTGVSIAGLAFLLSSRLDREVRDETGLTGNFDFALRWSPGPGASIVASGAGSEKPPVGEAASTDATGPSIFTALQEQLGLKLAASKGPIDVIVIDHIERPSEN